MRARSFSQWCTINESTDRNLQTERYQGLEQTSPLYAFGVQIYNWIQKTWPTLHHLYFNFLEVFQVSIHDACLLGKQRYIKALRTYQPDTIVSVHAHLNHAFRKVARDTLPNVQFVTYCGEMYGGYGFSKHWVDPKVDLFIGATPEICEAARRKGMPEDRNYYGGFMLHPNFYGPQLTRTDKHHYLEQLDLQPNRFTLLLSTGANGAQNHLAFLNHLATAQIDLQVIALCGRNQRARSDLNEWAQSHPQLRLKALAHVENMFPLMQCCDTIVARPGTGTTSEAIQANCPILFNAIGGIMPQEWITIKYCRNNQLPARLIKHSSQLIEQLRPMVEHPKQLAAIKTTMRHLTPMASPIDILNRIVQLSEKNTAFEDQAPQCIR
jgi:processive 1,2-diacylglycerol beta-glucosyltransferase